MSFLSAALHEPPRNPLDLVEDIVSANDWPFQRASAQELVAEMSGRWCDYHLFFGWVEEIGALQFSCLYDVKVPEGKRTPLHTLLALINEKMWLGHFGLCSEGGPPAFRHAMLLRGARGASVEQIEDLVDIALAECERFYPAFQLVVWGGKSAPEAIDAAVLETVGEA